MVPVVSSVQGPGPVPAHQRGHSWIRNDGTILQHGWPAMISNLASRLSADWTGYCRSVSEAGMMALSRVFDATMPARRRQEDEFGE
ncbi:hypothetical protein XI07_15525 [Bradyrhizobium sp. CCBAU 11445]|nr:hypothetical protein [Bradyrhizobium sp. CCBAU 11445]MDA9523367.1 hypothetical protein [Bradyrhizobium sp. CCBAU 11434]